MALFKKKLNKVVEQLCQKKALKTVFHQTKHDEPMPSVAEIAEIINLLKAVLFPGFFGPAEIKLETMKFYLGASLDKINAKLSKQIKRGDCFVCSGEEASCFNCENRAKRKTLKFIERIPFIREMLAKDAEAAFEGDPAAKQVGETIFCYPSLEALTSHRIAHELFKLKVELIPRIISELAHSKTGIDIHPGATIGEKFFIDHGTGVVIGETCQIGKKVRIYQGVTLGAKSFPLDEKNNPVKGIKRHPIIKDNVIIYSGATLLGRITIGENSIIGGNVWVTESVPPRTIINQKR